MTTFFHLYIMPQDNVVADRDSMKLCLKLVTDSPLLSAGLISVDTFLTVYS